jgi:hypothetical protein
MRVVVDLSPWVFIATHWTVTNWSSLEVVYDLFIQINVQADLELVNLNQSDLKY